MAVEVAGFFLMKGVYVYSPIAHCHPIVVACDLPKGWDFWQKYDECMIDRCDALLVLKAQGWIDSKGVQEEVRLAKNRGIPIHWIDYPNYQTWWDQGGRSILTGGTNER
jgi:hypothetical protein